MTTTPVLAPNIATYAVRAPYITPSEFREAGTGADYKQLVPGRASVQEQDAALARVIARASSWADTYCNKVLAATADITAGVVPVQNDGSLAVPLPNTPVIAVTAVSIGMTGASVSPMSDLSGVWIDGNIVRIANWGDATCTPGARSDRRFVAVTYVNGWANAVLTAAAAAGATSITVDNPLGIYPGMVLTVDDGGASEQAVVSATYVAGAKTVTLAAALTYDHAIGVGASMFPQFIKQAVILYTASLIRTRGSSAIVMGQTGAQADQTTSSVVGGSREQKLAETLLASLRRAW